MTPDFLDPELGLSRVCNSCRESWPLDDTFFYPFKMRGTVYFRHKCIDCTNAGDRARLDFAALRHMLAHDHKCPRRACPVWVPAGRRACYGHSDGPRTPLTVERLRELGMAG